MYVLNKSHSTLLLTELLPFTCSSFHFDTLTVAAASALSICSAAVWQIKRLKCRIPLKPYVDASARLEETCFMRLSNSTPMYLRKLYLLQEFGSEGLGWRLVLLSHYILVSGASLNKLFYEL